MFSLRASGRIYHPATGGNGGKSIYFCVKNDVASCGDTVAMNANICLTEEGNQEKKTYSLHTCRITNVYSA